MKSTSTLGLTKSLDIDVSGYDKQVEFFNATEYAIAFIGGLGSGKTHGGADKSLIYSLANPGASLVITAPTYRVLELATIPTYERVFPNELIKKKKSRPYPEWELTNGCKFYFWSTDKAWTIMGVEIAAAHMDEASRSPYEAYLNIQKRMRQRNKEGKEFPYQIWVTTTPNQLNWIYEEFVAKPKEGYKLIQVSTRQNIYLEGAEDYIKRMGLDPTSKTFQQDIEGKFVNLAGEALFGSEVIEKQRINCIEPTERRRFITIWKEPSVGVQYIAGADCSDEGGAGVNDCIIMDKATGEEVAEIYGDIEAEKFAQLCFDTCSEYNKALLAPERNGTAGGMVVEKLQMLDYPSIYKDDKGKIGWYTTTTAYPPKVDRFTMLIEYEEAVRTRQTIIRSPDALDEMTTFVRNANDRFEHLPNHTDDRIMARAICWQLRKEKPRTSFGFGSIQRKGTGYFNRPFGRTVPSWREYGKESNY